jgi:hypothetical protein
LLEDQMNAMQEYRLVDLGEADLEAVRGGTGSGPLAHDIGALVGGAVGLFMRIGESFYRSGGITGGNPWLRG